MEEVPEAAPEAAPEATPSSSSPVPDPQKLFIGGMPRTVTHHTLRAYFEKYGEVASICVPVEFNGKPRGFGFVRFADTAVAQRVLDEEHVIHERKVDVKRALPQTESHSPRQQQPRNQRHDQNGVNDINGRSREAKNKIFVGGLPLNLSEDDFRTYFEQFGEVTDAIIVCDNITHRPRGFGFITYEHEESVKDVMQQSVLQDSRHMHWLCGSYVEVKIANPKRNNRHNQHSGAVDWQYPLPYHSEYMDYHLRYAGYMLPSYGAYPYGANYYGGYIDMNAYHAHYVDTRFPWNRQPVQPMAYHNHVYPFHWDLFPRIEPAPMVQYNDSAPAVADQ